MTEERLKLFKHLGINSEEDLKDPVLNLQAARILKRLLVIHLILGLILK